MSGLNQIILLAEYNRLMNQRIMDAASLLSDEELKKDQKAFFKSILGTLNHILVGDIIWLKRFSSNSSSEKPLSYISGLEKPKSLSSILFSDIRTLKKEREKIDTIIINWVNNLSESDLSDYISYNDMAGQPYNKQFVSLINHLFLHQVHHRGQATTLLSQSGVDFGDTDLIEIIDEKNV